MIDLPQPEQQQPEPPIAPNVDRLQAVESLSEDHSSPLLSSQQCASLEKEWQAIQTRFVDSPRSSIEEADALVKKAAESLAAAFAEMRCSLERTWEKDKDVSTEDLRLALQSYRSFFHRLLSI